MVHQWHVGWTLLPFLYKQSELMRERDEFSRIHLMNNIGDYPFNLVRIVLVKALLLLCLDQRHRRHGVLSIAFCREFCCGLHPPMVPALQTVDHPGAFSIGRYFEMIIPGNDFLLFVLVGESELTDVLLLDHVWG